MPAPQRFGIAPTTASAQLQKAWPPHVGVQPLPSGSPGRVKPADLGIVEGSPTMFVIGDHGGIKDPTAQNAVTVAMEAEPRPAFVYSVGDVVYFNGDPQEYGPQFYEAYAHMNVPFLAIPGNHDGDVTDIPGRSPLDTFLVNFCAKTPGLPVGNEEYNRDTMTQPWCDWTLDDPLVTMIGLYTNVPSGGHLEQSQVDWLTQELKDADPAKPVILSLHHPPYSIDAHHGGSAKMGAALDSAFETSKRCADLVLSGHVHDAQLFVRTYWKRQIPYVVIGNSGYHNLHKFAPGATVGQQLAPDVVYEGGVDDQWGYLKLTVAGGMITGSMVGVVPSSMTTAPPVITPDLFRFSVKDGVVTTR